MMKPFLLLSALLASDAAISDCYLEDTTATCAVCWTTTFGVTKQTDCSKFSVEWIKPLPENMLDGVDYPVTWKMSVDPALEYVADSKLPNHLIPHVNVHSCNSEIGACTPMVRKTPGLSTHTPALKAEGFDPNDPFTQTFDTVVNLKEGRYNIIVHNRVYIKGTDTTSKQDFAIGIFRHVKLPDATSSESSIVTAGVAGSVVLLLLGGLAYAVSTGNINPEKFLENFLNGYLVAMVSLIIGLGDVISFTFTVVNMYNYPNYKTANILPVSFMVLGIGWFISLLKFLEDSLKIYDKVVMGGKKAEARIAKVTSDQIVMLQQKRLKRNKEATLSSGEAKSLKRQMSTSMTNTIKENPELAEPGRRLAQIVRKIQSLYYTILTIPLEQLPLIGLSIYLMTASDEVIVADTLTLLFSSIVLGANVMRVLSFPKLVAERDEIVNRFSIATSAGSNKVAPTASGSNPANGPSDALIAETV